MLKYLAKLNCKVNERDIDLTCDHDCPVEYIKEAMIQFSKYIEQIEENAKKPKEKDVLKKENTSCENTKMCCEQPLEV